MKDFHELAAQVLEELKHALASTGGADVLPQEILNAKRIFIAGKGRSGLQMRAFAMRLMHLGFTVHVVDDVTTPAIQAGDLLLIGSGSGRTPSLIQYARRAKELQARLALLTIDPHAPLAEAADCIVAIQAPTPKLEQAAEFHSIQPMGSLFEQTLGLVLDIVVVQLMSDLAISAEQMFARHANLE